MVGMVVLLLSAPAMAQSSNDWVDIKDANVLRGFYSNKTLRGRDGAGMPFVGHYSADGRGILIQGDRRTPRTWAVKGNDQVCATHANGTDCYTFQRHRKNRNEIAGRHSQVLADSHDAVSKRPCVRGEPSPGVHPTPANGCGCRRTLAAQRSEVLHPLHPACRIPTPLAGLSPPVR
jgi:hypothetical protein